MMILDWHSTCLFTLKIWNILIYLLYSTDQLNILEQHLNSCFSLLSSLDFFPKLWTGKNYWRESQLFFLGGKSKKLFFQINPCYYHVTWSAAARSRPLLLFSRLKSSLTLAAKLSRPEPSTATVSSVVSSMLYRLRLLPPLGTLLNYALLLVIHPSLRALSS